jgi:hypothetical protein
VPIERYCKEPDCPGGNGCTNKWRRVGEPCTMEYVASKDIPQYNWLGDGPPPHRWVAADGTHVYRSFSDYCDD